MSSLPINVFRNFPQNLQSLNSFASGGKGVNGIPIRSCGPRDKDDRVQAQVKHMMIKKYIDISLSGNILRGKNIYIY